MTTSTSNLHSAPEVPEAWVPVDQRRLGLDKRTIGPALLVLAWALLMALIVPAITTVAVPTKIAVIAAGDQILLDGGVTFTPPVGWKLTDGVVATNVPNSGAPNSVTLTQGAFVVTVQTDAYTGTPEQLLKDLVKAGQLPGTIGQSGRATSTNGAHGAIASLSSPNRTGLVATYVIDGTGVEIIVQGPETSANAPTDQIAAIITSVSKA